MKEKIVRNYKPGTWGNKFSYSGYTISKVK